MTELVDMINFASAVAGITLSIAGIILSLCIRLNDRKTRAFFIAIFSIATLYVLSDLTSFVSILFLDDNFALLTKAAIFMESLTSSTLMPLLTLFMLYTCGDEPLTTPTFYIVSALWGIYFFILVATQFTTAIYYVTDANIYRRGPLYPLLLVFPALLMFTNIMSLFFRKSRLTTKQFYAFLIYMLLPLAAMLIQMFFYGLLIIVLATTISILFLFVNVVQLQMEAVVRQSDENTRQEIDIMLLQIRPHFIYNTLSSAYYLCETDPRKAQQTIGNFTTYLRKNFSAVAKREPIPFMEELEHTKAYLTVEKARYESLLTVRYDVPHTSFYLPPLTLEPIVENAVKHGVDPDLEPLEITIHTAKETQGSVITVKDTGPGYNPSDDKELHVGLENVSKRLKMMCGGTLSISNRPEGGTVVEIRIPDQVLPSL